MLNQLALPEVAMLVVAALGIGFSKGGFAGVSMLHVVIFAHVFGAKASTGIVLPMLIVGDILALVAYGKRVHWHYFRRLLPPTIIGIVIGTLLMRQLDEQIFKPVVGTIILGLTCLQLYRMGRPDAFRHVPQSQLFAWALGLLAGVTTMMANAAGPIVALYLLAVALPKFELVGTGAWLFLVINVCKLPLSYFALDLITVDTLWVNAIFSPFIPLGMLAGVWAMHRIRQTLFNALLLGFTALAAIRLMDWL